MTIVEKFVISPLFFLFLNMASAQEITDYASNSPLLFETIRDQLMEINIKNEVPASQSISKDISDEIVNKHIYSMKELTRISEELESFFSDRFLQAEFDNSLPGYPILTVYAKKIKKADLNFIYTNKRYVNVIIESSRFDKNDLSQLDKMIVEYIGGDPYLSQIITGGYYEPRVDKYYLKTSEKDISKIINFLDGKNELANISFEFIYDGFSRENNMMEGASSINEAIPAAGSITPIVVRGGMPISTGSGPDCTIGFTVKQSNGRDGFITAGHCANKNSSLNIFPKDSLSRFPIGTTVASSNGWGNGSDYALVDLILGSISEPHISRYGRENALFAYGNYEWGIYTKPIRKISIPIKNSAICKTGAFSGETCGKITNPNTWGVTKSGGYGSYNVMFNIIETSLCSVKGDSGGPAYNLVESAAIGIVSAGVSSAGNFCKKGAVVGGAAGNQTLLVPIKRALDMLNVTLNVSSSYYTHGENCSSIVCLK